MILTSIRDDPSSVRPVLTDWACTTVRWFKVSVPLAKSSMTNWSDVLYGSILMKSARSMRTYPHAGQRPLETMSEFAHSNSSTLGRWPRRRAARTPGASQIG